MLGGGTDGSYDEDDHPLVPSVAEKELPEFDELPLSEFDDQPLVFFDEGGALCHESTAYAAPYPLSDSSLPAALLLFLLAKPVSRSRVLLTRSLKLEYESPSDSS